MISTSPHYLLFSEASRNRQSAPCWRFVLQNVESQSRFSAADTEPADCVERLELLAVVRGLEALDGPSRVTLVTKSRYVSRGIKSGLEEWRRNDWNWERFGRMVPIRDHDLWRRVDRALRFHEVRCQAWQFDSPAEIEETAECIESPAELVDQQATRNTRPRTRIQESTANSLPTASGLIRKVRRKLPRVGQFPEAVRALTRPMGQASGASA